MARATEAGADQLRAGRLQLNRPEFSTAPVLEIEAGRHPIVEQVVQGEFIPNSTGFNSGNRMQLVTGPRAVALNRAAAADVNDTATLGQTIAASGRETVVPLIGAQIARLHQSGDLCGATVAEMAETFVGLLIGDLQIRRVIGVIDPPDSAECERRAGRAISQLVSLYGPDHPAATGAAAMAPD